MSTVRKQREESQGPIHSKINQIIDQLDFLSSNINKKIPTQKEVEACALEVIAIINEYHKEISKFESYLKNAIIDLTEIPYMQPQMQKIAYEIAIRDAKKNLSAFLTSIAPNI